MSNKPPPEDQWVAAEPEPPEIEPEPETPREGRPSGAKALSAATKSIVDVATAVDGLVVLVKAGMSRAIAVIIVSGVFLAISTLGMAFLLYRGYAQTAAIDVLVTRVEQLAANQEQTRKAAEETNAKVDDAKAALESQPTVELVPNTKAGGRPAAVVRIKPAVRPKPPANGPEAPAPAAIELPVKLPPDAKLQAEADGGAEKR